MDPLSITASILAILKLTESLTKFIIDTNRATNDQQKLAAEANSLTGLLIQLHCRVKEARSNDPWFNHAKFLVANNGPLEQFQHILEKIVQQTTSFSNRERLQAALTWKWTKSEVNDALNRIERLKTLINIALTNDAFALSQAIHGEIANLTTRTSEIQLGVEELKVYASRDLQNKLSSWLRVPDPSTNYQAALKKRHAQTGSWLLATALQDIIQEASLQADAVVAYFYFDFNDVQKQHTQTAIRCLVFQFALQMPECLAALEQLYQQCNNGSQAPSEGAIRAILYDALALPRRKYIIIDALDECTDHENLLQFLQDLEVSQREVCVLATSRRERDIEEELQHIATETVDIQSAVVDDDIRVYIDDRLVTDAKLKKWPSSVKDEIIRELMRKANGMFRWAYCQLEALRKCIKLSALRKTLLSLPKDLDETYARIIQNIDSNDQLEDAIKILQWLCFSERPLTTSELVEVLAIKSGEDCGFDPDEKLPDPMDIMAICSSLILCPMFATKKSPRAAFVTYCTWAKAIQMAIAGFFSLTTCWLSMPRFIGIST
ncbi:hypothetical protein OHC33_009211 [Knufia fluminis]|uniref:Nephrocystin 3-like N-terminal domain-containing protein n=1 Tax=Knufia fluminis TaxID=191047 RepID=A0AAN8IJ60_9EURO|nr:hypothetical protein OHC33_009211 [Knufia fluminis]